MRNVFATPLLEVLHLRPREFCRGGCRLARALVVKMTASSGRNVDDASGRHSPLQVDLLEVQVEALVESAGALECRSPNRHDRARDCRNTRRSGQRPEYDPFLNAMPIAAAPPSRRPTRHRAIKSLGRAANLARRKEPLVRVIPEKRRAGDIAIGVQQPVDRMRTK